MAYLLEHARSVEAVLDSIPILEGAGVALRRVFSDNIDARLDPFLLLDHMRSSDPAEYKAGFPWHPHRGFETVTYMVHGVMEHQDSIGNRGVIGEGDVQWMTAGRGIIHQEMPEVGEGLFEGFQLWVNLPASQKMMMPQYRSITREEIPQVRLREGGLVRVIAGLFHERRGPVEDLVVPVSLFDVSLPMESVFSYHPPDGWHVFAFPFEGEAKFDGTTLGAIGSEHIVILTDDGEVQVTAGMDGVRFLLGAGQPVHEPVAWRGSIVMNTEEELRQAMRELQNGTFIHPEFSPT